MTLNDRGNVVSAWTTDAADTNRTMNALTNDNVGKKQTRSSRPADQSQLSVAGHDTKHPRTQGQHQSISQSVKFL